MQVNSLEMVGYSVSNAHLESYSHWLRHRLLMHSFIPKVAFGICLIFTLDLIKINISIFTHFINTSNDLFFIIRFAAVFIDMLSILICFVIILKRNHDIFSNMNRELN